MSALISDTQPVVPPPRPVAAPPDGRRRRNKSLLLTLPLVVLFAFGFIIPMVEVLRFAFTAKDSGFSFREFSEVFTNPFYAGLILRTLQLALITTAISIVLSYPVAIAIVRGPRALRTPLTAIVALMPLMISVVVKTFGWTVLLGNNGGLQSILDNLGIPVTLLFSKTGVVIGLVHNYMPFMLLSLIAAIATIDHRTEEAAISLGSPPLAVFFKITLPQTYNGLAAGAALTFVTSMSAFVTPQLLGGGNVDTIVSVIYDQATAAQNNSLASALGVILLVIVFVILAIQTVVVRRATRT